jgi:TonB family protein
VTAAIVVESSGIAVLDREALRAVQTSHPLPPLPRGFPGTRLGITFIFTTRLDY